MSSFEGPKLEFIHGIQSGLLMRLPGGAIVQRWETFAETLGAIWLKRRALWEGGERVDSESFPPGDARVRPGSAPPPLNPPPPLFPPSTTNPAASPAAILPQRGQRVSGARGGLGIRAPLGHRCNPCQSNLFNRFNLGISTYLWTVKLQALNFCG